MPDPDELTTMPAINVLLSAFEDQFKSLSPVQHQLAAIAPQVLFQTPTRLSKHFPNIKVHISSNGQSYELEALLDSGATATYIAHSFIEDNQIPMRRLEVPLYVFNADDSINKKSITHEAKFTIIIQGHRSTEWFYVAELGTKQMVIGMTWLRSHNPVIDWRSGRIEFTRCPGKCGGQDQTISNLKELLERTSKETNLMVKLLSPHAKMPTRGSTQAAGYDLSSAQDIVIPTGKRALVRTDISVTIPSGTYARIAPRSGLALKNGINVGAGVVDADYTGPVGVILFNHGYEDFVVKTGDRIAQLILERIRTPEVIETKETSSTSRGASGFGSTGTSVITQHSVNRIWHSINSKENVSTTLAIEDLKKQKVLTIEDIRNGPFADYIDIFEESGFQKLPPHRKWDHKIDLVPDWKDKIWKPRIYPLTHNEQKELDEFIVENKANGRIRESESPFASPVFFISKKDGGKRMVIDYRKLNALTEKNAYPLPLIDELISRWKGCVRFSALDVRAGYWNVRIREGDEWKTAFITQQGLFESTVMTFGLCNAPATFQTMMDSIFVVYVRRGTTGAYIDDVGIATKPDPEGRLSYDDYHIKAVKQILEVFREHKLFLKPSKCTFLQTEIKYLGHIISGSSIRPDPVKLDGVRKWPVPQNLKQLRSFLGFLNYYRRFIHNYSLHARPLHDLTKKDKVTKKEVPWEWKNPQQEAFDLMVANMLSAPVLAYPNPQKSYVLETDASNVAYGAVLSQEQDDGKWHPVAFMSKSFTPTEKEYHAHDRELLAIIAPLKEWRHLLQGAKHQVVVLSDHANLTYFRKKQDLNSRQIRWALYLEEFDLIIRHRPGRQSSVPDALSRRADHGESASKQERKAQVLLSDALFDETNAPPSSTHKEQINSMEESSPTSSLRHKFYLAQAQDPIVLKLNLTKEGEDLPAHWSKPEDLWLYWGKIYIPEELRQTVFRVLHADPSAGHPGQRATLYSIRNDYYWPNLKADVIEWIRNCDICQRTKVFPKKPHGELKPIDPVPRPWGVVTSDLVTGLPPCKGYTAIWTATCKRLKYIHIAPTHDTLDSAGLYHLYLDRIWKLHGTSDKLITDRGPQFSSRYARDVNKNLQIETAMSTAYHPQTDGQSERTNQEVEQVLRTVVNFHQDDWVDWLPVVEFALNNRYKTSLKTTPFYASYGFHPQIGSLPKIDTPIVSVENFVAHLQQVQKDTAKSLEQAAVDMKRFYDRHRGKTPEFAIGQKVLLDNADLSINRPSRKLAERRSGPFKVLERIGTHAYKLELPSQWKTVHPVFHVSKIEEYHEDPKHPNHPSPPPDVIEGEPEWEVEEIRDAKFAHNKIYFLVKWKGWPDSEVSWEPEDNLENSPEIISSFYKQHPGAPRRLSTGEPTGQPLTKRTRKKKKRTRVNEIHLQPLRASTTVDRWPNGPMSRDATF